VTVEELFFARSIDRFIELQKFGQAPSLCEVEPERPRPEGP
jgi:hypothetical protein